MDGPTGRPGKHRWLSALLFLAACGGRETLEVKLPDDFLNGAETILVALEADARILQVGLASPRLRDTKLREILPTVGDYDSEPLVLTVVKSARTLTELGLQEGPLVEPPEGSLTRRVLPLFEATPGLGSLELRRASITGERVSAFEAAIPSERLARVSIVIDSLCEPPNLSVRHGTSPLDIDVRVVGIVPDGRMIYAGSRLRRIDEVWVRSGVVGGIELVEGGVELGPAKDLPETVSVQALEWRADSFVAYDSVGKFLELTPDGEVTRSIPATTSGGHRIRVGADGVALAFSPSQGLVSELSVGSTIAVPMTHFPPGVRALALESRDRVIVFASDWTLGNPDTGTFSDGALWFCDRSECTRSLDVEGPVLWADAHAGPNGFAALINSDILIHRDGAWQTFTGLSLESSTIPKNGIAPAGDGYLVVGDVGYANFYTPEQGWCDNERARRIVGRNRNLERLNYNRDLPGIAIASDGIAIRWLPPPDPANPPPERDFEIGDGSVLTAFEYFVGD